MSSSPVRRYRIIIPVHNRLEQTRQVLACLRAQKGVEPEIYIVDDGSTDGAGEFLAAQQETDPRLHVLKGDGSLWWTGAIHMAMAAISPELDQHDVVVWMNNDVHVDSDFFLTADTLLDRYPNAVLGPLPVNRQSETIATIGSVMVSWPLALTAHPHYGEPSAQRHLLPEIIPLDFVGGKATFIPASVVLSTGNVNADMLPHYHADYEYVYRAKRAGYDVFACRDLALYIDTTTTGSFNDFGQRNTFGQFRASLTDIRSVNNLRYKWNFARLCCPRRYLIPYLLFDTAKMIMRSLVTLIGSRHAPRIRRVANRLLGNQMRSPSQ